MKATILEIAAWLIAIGAIAAWLWFLVHFIESLTTL